MPEVFLRVRWPDGSTEQCYSPSLVIEDFFVPGGSYELVDFVRRSREALTEASERVRAKYGFGCSNADRQLERIEQQAARFRESTQARVIVEGFERC